MAADFKLLGGHPLWIRLLSLYGGLFLFGLSAGLVIESRLGNSVDVLHEGAALRPGMGIPLRGRRRDHRLVPHPALWIRGGVRTGHRVERDPRGRLHGPHDGGRPDQDSMAVRIILLVCGIVLNGIATVLYIIPSFGPGPRRPHDRPRRAHRPAVWAMRLIGDQRAHRGRGDGRHVRRGHDRVRAGDRSHIAVLLGLAAWSLGQHPAQGVESTHLTGCPRIAGFRSSKYLRDQRSHRCRSIHGCGQRWGQPACAVAQGRSVHPSGDRRVKTGRAEARSRPATSRAQTP